MLLIVSGRIWKMGICKNSQFSLDCKLGVTLMTTLVNEQRAQGMEDPTYGDNLNVRMTIREASRCSWIRGSISEYDGRVI